MEINVGIYARVTNYENKTVIGKITELIDEQTYLLDTENEDTSGQYVIDKNDKHSKDIIKVLEKGDYVNGKKVIFTKNNFPKGNFKNNKNDVIFTDYNDEYGEWFGFENDEIETILTHEQFKANAYVLEKER